MGDDRGDGAGVPMEAALEARSSWLARGRLVMYGFWDEGHVRRAKECQGGHESHAEGSGMAAESLWGPLASLIFAGLPFTRPEKTISTWVCQCNCMPRVVKPRGIIVTYQLCFHLHVPRVTVLTVLLEYGLNGRYASVYILGLPLATVCWQLESVVSSVSLLGLLCITDCIRYISSGLSL